jgi:tetraacyldisaccharide 4'-kinase
MAVLLRFFLRAVSYPYCAAVMLRNYLYTKGLLKEHQAATTVISVGNITVGGTGKTPLVIWLSNSLRQKGIKCAILTRGYKTGESKLSDEPAILAKNCPAAKVVVKADRVVGAAEAIDKFGATVLVMDDGFQHRRLSRDLNIVTIDATGPFGYGKILPAGLLREPVASLKRAHAVVITRCDQTTEPALKELEQTLYSINPDMVIARSTHMPVCAKAIERKEISLEELKDRKVFAFCGIGNPNAFLATINKLGINPVGSRIFNDHHHYMDECLADIYEEARYLGADLVLTTEKDWTKTALPARIKDILFAYLAIEIRFLTGEEQLRRLIQDTLADIILKKKSRNSNHV